MTTSTKRVAAVPSFAAARKTRRLHRGGLEARVVAESCRADAPAVLKFLNEALASQLLCVLRYRRHHFMARGLAAGRVAEEFQIHADEELAHADLIAERIVQLGGEPDFAPATLYSLSPAAGVSAGSIVEMIRENLSAARSAIDSYRDRIERLGEADRATRRLLEGILAVHAAHAEELAELL